MKNARMLIKLVSVFMTVNIVNGALPPSERKKPFKKPAMTHKKQSDRKAQTRLAPYAIGPDKRVSMLLVKDKKGNMMPLYDKRQYGQEKDQAKNILNALGYGQKIEGATIIEGKSTGDMYYFKKVEYRPANKFKDYWVMWIPLDKIVKLDQSKPSLTTSRLKKPVTVPIAPSFIGFAKGHNLQGKLAEGKPYRPQKGRPARRGSKTLDFKGRGITEIDAAKWPYGADYEIIDLSDNQLQSLPADLFKGMKNLRFIYLQNNQLTTLPEDIFQPEVKVKNRDNLEAIDLSKNQLQELPENIFKGLKNLWYLNISDNKLSILQPNLFAGLTRLNDLYLSGNNLRFLPGGIFNDLVDIDTITLEGNSLSQSEVQRLIEQMRKRQPDAKIFDF